MKRCKSNYELEDRLEMLLGVMVAFEGTFMHILEESQDPDAKLAQDALYAMLYILEETVYSE